jgi:hypothetical protein
MGALAILRGPKTMLLSLLQRDKLAFSGAYVGSLVFTLYATLGPGSYLLTVIAILAQLTALGYFAASFMPGGTSGMGWVTRTVASGVFSGSRRSLALVMRMISR